MRIAMHQMNRLTRWAGSPVLILALCAIIILPLHAQNTPAKNQTGAATTDQQKPNAGKKAVATSKRVIDPKKITWLNFSDGLKYARAEKKHVLLDFTASWCGWCKKMDAETFSDSTIIRYINDHFIPVKVWADSEEKLDLDGHLVPQSAISSEMFKVQGLPTFHYLRGSDQKLIRGNRAGYKTRDVMFEELKYVHEERYVPATKSDTDSPQKETNE